MEVTLPNDMLEFVNSQVAEGTYRDAHQAILVAIYKLKRETEAAAFHDHLLAMPEMGEDWMFDRNDPRNRGPEKKPIDFFE